MKIKRIISIANDLESRMRNEENTNLVNYCQLANGGYKIPRVNTIEFFRQILRVYNIQPLRDWINARVPVPLEHINNIRDVYFSFDDVFQFVER